MAMLLRTRPATTPPLLALFDDAATIAHALAFEAALARAEADCGLIDGAIADAIGAASRAIAIDAAILADEAALAGTLAIPLVKRLRAALDGDAAKAVHRGATSQDLADTVLMLQLAGAIPLILADARRVVAALTALAERHAATPAIGRTLLQDALPIGFGLRIAHWAAGIAAATDRLAAEIADGLPLQFGGAAGTRAGLDGKGADVAAALARHLGLASPPGPWQAERTTPAALAAALAILTGALGKMARDISLLAQNAVGEAREGIVAGRGGSSAMAHKRNPTGCQVALSAALRSPGLTAIVLGAMPQEEERGLGGWQAEGPVLAELAMLAGGAAAVMADVAEGLDIDEAAIARNIAAAGIGEDIGESAALVTALLAPSRKAD
ncbi:lyase family protein [Sphingomonas naphthae]|uniref:Lyase family protein n=1 Tax=Sphingomonas naphthae TaxID=1813468 RepID=A0ABY7TI66_9SPHN|nr:lyase family protein [Sphingomonas naphthae]WCT72860.1 lyase family protein [Sphingomonas naphthae]